MCGQCHHCVCVCVCVFLLPPWKVRLEVVGEELTVGVETKLSVRPVPRDLFATCVQLVRNCGEGAK